MARRGVPDVSQLVGRTLHALEPVAPDWFVQVLTPKRAPVPWATMVRSAVSVTVPLGVGLAVGEGPLGGFAAMGALLGSFGDAGGPFVRRLRRTSLGIAGGLLGLVLGRLLISSGLWAIAIVGGVAVLSAVVSALTAELSFAGLQLLVYLAISTGPASAVPLPPLILLFLIGAAWAILLSFVQTRVLPEVDRPQQTVATVLDELIALLRVMSDDGATDDADRAERIAVARRRIGVAVGTAYDAMTTARAHSAGRRSDLRRLTAVLSAVSNLTTVAIASARTDPVEPASAIPDIEALRDRIASGRRSAAVRPLPTAEQLQQNPTASALARAIAHLERSSDESIRTSAMPVITTVIALDQVRAATESPRTRPDRPGRLVDALAGRKTWLFAARLALTLMAAEVVLQVLPLTRSYWVLLTVAVVLKPDLGSVFARGVQRTLGTLVGVLIGAAVVALVPDGPLLLIPVAVFSLLFPFGASRNYGMLATFITPLVLILIDFGGTGLRGVAADRLLDTAIGAAVVLLVGYLPWPATWRPKLGLGIANGIDAIADYAAVAFSGEPSSVIGPARRRAYGAVSNMRSDLQSLLAEPTRQARESAKWFPLVAQLESTTDDLRDAAVLDIRIPQASVGPDVHRITAALRDLAGAVREGRAPDAAALPDSGILLNVAGDILGARRILTGPPPG